MKGPIEIIKPTSPLAGEAPKEWPQIFAIISGSITAFICGLLFSWPSPAIPQLISDEYGFTLEESSYLTVIPPISAIIGSFLYSKLVDKIGRKKTLLTNFVPQVLSLLLIAFANNIYVFYVSRFITGFADACMFTVLPCYVGEISTPKVRGVWGNVLTLAIYTGQMSINIIGGYTSIKVSAWIMLVFPILFLCTFSFVPESPYYLIMKGRRDEACESLKRLRRIENVEEEMTKLDADVNRQMSESGTWKDLFTIDSNKIAIRAGIFLRLSQQLCGISSFSVYTQYIFEQAGGSLSATESSIIFSSCCLLLNFAFTFVLDKIGRRSAMIFSLPTTGAVLMLEAAFLYISSNTSIDVSGFMWVPLAGMIMFLVVYSVGLGIVPTLMLGELFSASIKGKGLCFLNVLFSVYVSTLTKLFQVLQTKFGLYMPFAFFGVCCFVNTFLAYYFVPETKGKTLEEIQQSLKSKKNKTTENC